MKICPYCKKEVSEADKFCGWCGKKLPIEPTLEEPIEEEPIKEEPINEEKGVLEKIRERAREEELERKRMGEKEREGKRVGLIREKAKIELEERQKIRSGREQLMEKLTRASSEEVKRREEFLKRLGMKKGKKPKEEIPTPLKIKEKEVIFRPLPQKPSFKQKLWVRVLIALFLLGILAAIFTFWYWYFIVNK